MWEAKVMAIKDAQNLMTLKLQDLIRELISDVHLQEE